MNPGFQVGVGLAAGARLLVVAACLAALPACEPEMAETAVFVEVFRLAPAPVPDRLLVTWLDARQVLLQDQAVPASGSLDPQPGAAGDGGVRDRAAGRRIWSGGCCCWGCSASEWSVGATSGLTVQPRAWVTRAVPLTADMPADGDNDGMPDAIDNCQGSDFAGCPAP